MTDRVCLEWALADENKLTDIVVAAGNDRIIFPHVDSCCAIIFLMTDNTAIGGHATLQIRNQDVGYDVSATDMLTRMVARANGRGIAQIIYVGHPDWDEQVVAVQNGVAAIANIPSSNRCQFNDPIDVFADLGDGRLRVQAWTRSIIPRAAAALPDETGVWLYDHPFVARRTQGGCCPCVIL